MTKIETAKILAILRGTFPKVYQSMSQQEQADMLEIWYEMFMNDDYRLVSLAVKELLGTHEFPPTIATIKNKMYDMTHIEELSNTDLWDALLKAIRNGYYGYQEEYDKLPKEVQQYLKSPYQLRELAGMNSSDIHSVVKGQFLKQIEIIRNRKKEIEKMLPETRELLINQKNNMLLEEKNG